MHIRQKASVAAALLFTVTAVGSVVINHLRVTAAVPTAEAAPLASDEPPSSVPVVLKPEAYHGSFLYSSAIEQLAALGVKVAPEDIVTAFPAPSLGIGSEIRVYRAAQATITDGTASTPVRTWSRTVGDLLAERRIELGDQDKIVPSLDTPIPFGGQPLAITITRVAETTVEMTQPVDFTTVYQDDPTSEIGTQTVQQAGKPGVLTKTYLVRRENGVEVSRTLTGSAVTTKPVSKIVLRGTKVVTYGAGKASWYAGVGAMTAAHLTLPKGTKVKVVNTDNGKSVVVTIADRGPYVAGRIIDLSKDAFAAIASLGSGVANVEIEKYYDGQ